MLQWNWKKFDELLIHELYDILRVRQDVFVIGQNCIYDDVDNIDQKSWHLFAWDNELSEVVAYLRVIFPGIKYKEPAIGRLLTVERVRKTGLGKELLKQSLEKVDEIYPQQGVRISAQLYLQSFYEHYGFEQISAPYEEEGIPHIEMLRKI